MPVEEIEPLEAWDRLSGDADAVLVDVRTPEEWTGVGIPDLTALSRQPVLLTWAMPRIGQPGIAEGLAALGIDRAQPVLFLCRAGIRSLYAAMEAEAAGYRTCINVAAGFEGEPDAEGRRGSVNGWQADGLPWQRPDPELMSGE